MLPVIVAQRARVSCGCWRTSPGCSPTGASPASSRDRERRRALAESSPSIVTPLNRLIGYEEAAKIAKQAVAARVTIRQAVIDLGFVDRGEIDEADPRPAARRPLDDAPRHRPDRAPLRRRTAPSPSGERRRPGACGSQYQPVAWLCAHAQHGEPYTEAM